MRGVSGDAPLAIPPTLWISAHQPRPKRLEPVVVQAWWMALEVPPVSLMSQLETALAYLIFQFQLLDMFKKAVRRLQGQCICHA